MPGVKKDYRYDFKTRTANPTILKMPKLKILLTKVGNRNGLCLIDLLNLLCYLYTNNTGNEVIFPPTHHYCSEEVKTAMQQHFLEFFEQFKIDHPSSTFVFVVPANSYWEPFKALFDRSDTCLAEVIIRGLKKPDDAILRLISQLTGHPIGTADRMDKSEDEQDDVTMCRKIIDDKIISGWTVDDVFSSVHLYGNDQLLRNMF